MDVISAILVMLMAVVASGALFACLPFHCHYRWYKSPSVH